MPMPPHVPTDQERRLVLMLTAGGVGQRAIAVGLGMSWTTLKKHYKSELVSGAIKANGAVIASLYRQATGAHPQAAVAAAKWWTQARMGWTEKHEFSGPGGTPFNPPGQTYVVRMPTPVESVKQWMDAYVPETEREPT